MDNIFRNALLCLARAQRDHLDRLSRNYAEAKRGLQEIYGWACIYVPTDPEFDGAGPIGITILEDRVVIESTMGYSFTVKAVYDSVECRFVCSRNDNEGNDSETLFHVRPIASRIAGAVSSWATPRYLENFLLKEEGHVDPNS